jgi:hypothetical protein
MAIKNSIWVVLVFASGVCLAQFQIPRIDVEIKASQVLLPASDNQNSQSSLNVIATTNLLFGAHVQINQYLAAGWFYSSSFRGSGYNSTNFKGNIFKDGDSKAITSMNGPEIRVSTGRAAKWRPYLNVNYCNLQVVEDKDAFRFSTKVTAIGGSIGIMRRYGNHLYWNVFEAGVKKLSERLFWADNGTDIMIEMKTGFTYNIGKRK